MRHMVWGAAIKPFYRDSLSDLRRATYDLFHTIISLYRQQRHLSNTVDNLQPGQIRPPKVSPLTVTLKIDCNFVFFLKVVLVTRNDSVPINLPLRKLSAETEERIANAFKQQWQALQPIQAAPWPSPRAAEVTICCDFSFLHSIDAFIEHFYDADICIGMQLLFSYKWSDFNGPGWVGLG